jgi:hypothetical protein
MVWLSTSNISTTRPSRELDWKRVGPYRILWGISTHAFKLDLPGSVKIHPIFHVSLLEAAANNSVLGQIILPPAPVKVNSEQEWLVEHVLDSRTFGRGKTLYDLINWRGYDDPSWQPAECLIDSLQSRNFRNNTQINRAR